MGNRDHFAEVKHDIFRACMYSLQIFHTQSALFSLGEFAPILATAGSVSELCAIPFAVVILFNIKMLGDCAGDIIGRYVSQRAGVFVQQAFHVISKTPGLHSLLKGVDRALPALFSLTLLVSSVAGIYFAGAYILGSLSLGYQLFDVSQRYSESPLLSEVNDVKFRCFVLGLILLSHMNVSSVCGSFVLIRFALEKPPAPPTFPELEIRELSEMIVDTISLQVDEKHLRPGNPLKGLPPGFDYAKELREMHRTVKLDPKVVLAKRYQKGTDQLIQFTDFEVAKAHISKGIEKFINGLRSGSPNQRALVSRAIFQAKQGSLMDRQDLISYFADVGYVCQSGKVGGIDEINAGFGGTGLVAQLEHILRLKRDELYNELFWSVFIDKFPELFGPDQKADPNDVHTSAAWLFESKATNWALSSYGRALEETEGINAIHNLRIARAVLADGGVKAQLEESNAALTEAYNAQLVLDTVCEALKHQPKATLGSEEQSLIQGLAHSSLFQEGVIRLASVDLGKFKDDLDTLQTQVFGTFAGITEWQRTIGKTLFTLYIEERKKESSDQRTEEELALAAEKIALQLKQDRQKESSLNANLFIQEWFIEWAIRNKKAEFTRDDQVMVGKIEASSEFKSAVDTFVVGESQELQADAFENAVDDSARVICRALGLGLEELAPIFTSHLIKFVVEKRRLDAALFTESVLEKNREGIETVLLEAKAAQLAFDFCYDEMMINIKPEAVATMLVERGILKQPEPVAEGAPLAVDVQEAATV